MIDLIQIDNLQKANGNSDLSSNKSIIKLLLTNIALLKTTYALTSNQLGICDHRCAVVVVKKPIMLVNPRITVQKCPFVAIESCILHPQKILKTIRYSYIEVEHDLSDTPLTFGVLNDDNDINANDPNILESVFVQQCIYMLDAKTMYDFEYNPSTPIKKQKTPTRNQFVTIVKDEEEKTMKFKMINGYLNDGWKLKTN